MATIPIVALALSDGSSNPFGVSEIREKVYPKTHYLAVEGLLENGKFALNLMHPATLGHSKFAGSITTSKSLAQLLDIIAASMGDEQLFAGSFLTANNNISITASSGHIIENGDEGEMNVSSTNLNKNDNIILKEYNPGSWASIESNVDFGNEAPSGLAEPGDKYVQRTDADSGILYEYGTSWESLGEVLFVESVYGESSLPKIGNDNQYAFVRTYALTPIPGSFVDYGTIYQYNTTSTSAVWSVINNNNDEAIGASTTGGSKPGLISAADISKLYNIEAGALNNPHPTDGANKTITLAGNKKIAAVTVNSLGHVTAITDEDIQSATTEQKGLVELATNDEHATGTDTTRAATVAGVREMQKKFGDAHYYEDLSAANATIQGDYHPAGTLALIKVSEVYV